jgi:hypothetical protein
MVFSAPGEASDLAKTGELKAGQQMLKEATGEGRRSDVGLGGSEAGSFYHQNMGFHV